MTVYEGFSRGRNGGCPARGLSADGRTRPNLSRILNGRASISAVMSVRLAKAMPYTSPEFWLKMQLNYDLWKAQKNRQPKIKPFPARPQKELASTLIRHRRRPIANPELL